VLAVKRPLAATNSEPVAPKSSQIWQATPGWCSGEPVTHVSNDKMRIDVTALALMLQTLPGSSAGANGHGASAAPGGAGPSCGGQREFWAPPPEQFSRIVELTLHSKPGAAGGESHRAESGTSTTDGSASWKSEAAATARRSRNCGAVFAPQSSWRWRDCGWHLRPRNGCVRIAKGALSHLGPVQVPIFLIHFSSRMPVPSVLDEKDKPRTLCCVRTRDGRVHVSIAASATLSPAKASALGVGALLLLLLLLISRGAPGEGDASALRARVRALEAAMGSKLAWVLQHQRHIRKHLPSALGGAGKAEGAWAPALLPDGRRHLLSPPGGVSRLAEALAPNTRTPAFDDHYLCGTSPLAAPGREEELEDAAVRKKIALAAVTWRAPLSLRNSMESWRRGGLLDIVDERMLFVNSPSEEDLAIAREYEFDVYTTAESGGNIMAGPALAHLAANASADTILFMEKDFVLSADRATMMRELFSGVQHLARGVDLFRLRGKSDWPAEGMPNCCEVPADPEKPACPFHSQWRSGGYFSDHQNWLLVYCDPNVLESGNGRVAQCAREPEAPDSFCFSSGDSNWSNNPLLMNRLWFLEKVAPIALADMEHNERFEFNAMMSWLSWRPPAKICASLQGIFTHIEIDQ
jgi:hypothetical protein